jgi:hypothetical protein
MAVTTSSCGPVDPQFIAVSKSCFGRLFWITTYFVAWLTTSEDFRPVENLVYGAIRNTPLFVETEFLSLAQECAQNKHRDCWHRRYVSHVLTP